MLRSKYYQQGEQAAHNGLIRFSSYKLAQNILDFHEGYDSVVRTHQVMKFSGNPIGKQKDSYQAKPELVYVGSLVECEDKAITLRQSDRDSFFVVYTADGKPYQYKSSIENNSQKETENNS